MQKKKKKRTKTQHGQHKNGKSRLVHMRALIERCLSPGAFLLPLRHSEEVVKVPREKRADCLFLPSSCIVSLISLSFSRMTTCVCYLIQGATRAIPERLGF